tara:strand:+ start:1823 stop:2314 length:492 start_codon:yes stop_codon:yes gene_type:complete
MSFFDEYDYSDVRDIVDPYSFDVTEFDSVTTNTFSDYFDASDVSGSDILGAAGTANSLLNLFKSGTSAASGLFGGGSGESKGFVAPANKALSDAQNFQSGQILRQSTQRERSEVGQARNNHSMAIISALYKSDEASLRAFSNQLSSVAGKAGTRSRPQARATA